MYKGDHHRRTSGQGDWTTEAGHRRRAKLGTKGPHGSPSAPPALPAKARLVRSPEKKQQPTPTAQQSGAEDRKPLQADEVPSEPVDQDATLLTEEELVEARFREEMIERRLAEMLQKRGNAGPPETEGPLHSPPPPTPTADTQGGLARPTTQARRQMQTTQEPRQNLYQEQILPVSQSTPQELMQIQQKQMQTPAQLGPKELMRRRMLASKLRRQGVAALQSGEAAAALAALSDAQALTPDDGSLAPLVQRAQVMMGRQEAEVGAAIPADGRGDGEDGPPRPAAPAPVPPRATAGAADALPEGWAEGSLEGTPFYYPVSDPSRIQWSPPLAAAAATAVTTTLPPPPPMTTTPSSHTADAALRSASRTTRAYRQPQEEPLDVEEPPRVFYQVDGGGAVAFRRSPE